MKKLITLLFLLTLMFTLWASPDGTWSIGFSSGYSNNAVLSQKGYRIDTGYENGHGFSVSIPVNYKVNDSFSVESGVTYVQKNFTWSKIYRSDSETMTFSQTQTNGFVEFPLSLCFSITNGTASAVASAGSYIGVWAHSYRTDRPYNSSVGLKEEGKDDTVSGYHDFTKADNRFEFGFIFTAGVEVEISKTVMFLRGVYDIALTDLSSDYQIDRVVRHDSTFRAEAGMRFLIGGAV